jgi:C-terminal processing protease CtpA/Prc
VRRIQALVSSLLLAACGQTPASSHLKDEFSGSAFFYYDQADRVEILGQLKKAMSNNYSLRDIKAQRIGVDTTALFDAALAEETEIGNADSPKVQAAENLAFLDRVHKVIASYQDTHLGMQPVVSSPVIMNGLELREVDGKFYVVAMRKKLIEYASVSSSVPDAYERISLGDQVLSIDGQPVDSLVEDLIGYEAASSPGFRRMLATKRVTIRDYAYPEKPVADYKLIKANGDEYSVRLPYFYQTSDAVRADAKFLLEERGFIALRDLRLAWNDLRKTWDFKGESIPTEGFDKWTQVPAGMVGIQEWLDQDYGSDLALRTGYLLKGGKAYGVAQIFTFMVGTMKNSASGVEVQFADGLKSFVAELKNNGTPLIIDLRNNGGGITQLPPTVLAAIGKTNETYPTFTRAARITRHLRQMAETYVPSNLGPVGYDVERAEFDQLKSAIADRRSHTFAHDASEKIKSSIGGYDQRVVVMITPNCISSCDITSMLMEASNRVTLLGTHSNGTGAGMTSAKPFTGAGWTDDFDVISVNIPNFLFGRPGPMNSYIHSGNAYYELNSENVPVQASVQYDYTLDDFLNGSAGWFEKAIEILSAP